MSRLHALFAAIFLSLACTCVGAVGAFADQSSRASALIANKTHRRAQNKHGHVCRAARNSHHKHFKRCRRSMRARHSAHMPARARTQSRARIHPTGSPARALHLRLRSRGVTVDLAHTPVPTSTANATLVAVLAAPCQNSELTPQPGNLEQVQLATLCLINQERARNGEGPLRSNAQLAQAAQRHSQSMVGEDYFSHLAPGGETPTDRLLASGYLPNSNVGYTIGENLAWGTLSLATPHAIVAAWIASPEHLANILNAEYRDSGVAVTAAAPPSLSNGQAGAVYTQEFGVLTG